jgi:hypothetical protein
MQQASLAEIQVLQTTDPVRYRPLFDITSSISQRFCDLHDLSYAPFIGIKRGDRPWHATFNRIPLFSELANRGFAGWAIYLDADAYFFDLAFDIHAYLEQNKHWAVIGAPGGEGAWQVNAGILLLNFGHPATLEIVNAWQKAFDETMPDSLLLGLPDWADDVPNDQTMLHQIMYHRPDHAEVQKVEPLSFLGASSSTFIRQVLRFHGDFAARINTARTDAASALARIDAIAPSS